MRPVSSTPSPDADSQPTVSKLFSKGSSIILGALVFLSLFFSFFFAATLQSMHCEVILNPRSLGCWKERATRSERANEQQPQTRRDNHLSIEKEKRATIFTSVISIAFFCLQDKVVHIRGMWYGSVGATSELVRVSPGLAKLFLRERTGDDNERQWIRRGG